MKKIGDYILRNIPDLIESWESDSRRLQPDARDEQRQQLRDSLPDFLHDFGDNLHRQIDAIPEQYAIEHGAQRWALGWDIEELVRDFMILRRVLIRSLRRDLDIGVDDAMEIAATLDEAVAVSVHEYANQQTRDLKEHNEKLERSNHELQRFASVLAHEIRNPMATIRMCVDDLRRKLPQGSPAMEDTEMALEGVQEVQDLITEMLGYARTGDINEKPQPVDLSIAYEDALLLLANGIRANNAEVTADELPTVSGYPRRLAQVLQNLIENALKYRSSADPKVHVSATRHESGWQITVEDNGIGIPPEHHKDIFRFLVRAHDNPEIHGTGIGLSLCRRIIEDSGGRIWVDSEVGEGSRFHFTLPAPKEGS